MTRWPAWLACPTTTGDSPWPLDLTYRACVFNKIRLAVVAISFLIWFVAVRLDISPRMTRPALWLLLFVSLIALLGIPIYAFGAAQRSPSLLMTGWVYTHSLSDLVSILLAIHFTGGLESPGNMLLLTYLAGVALVFPRLAVLSLASLTAMGYLVLGVGYAYGWWQALYSNGLPQPPPTFRHAVLVTLSDWIFIVLVSSIVLYLRQSLERAYEQLRQERNDLARLRDVVHEGLQHRQVDHLAHHLAYHIGALVGAREASLVLWDERRQMYTLLARTASHSTRTMTAKARSFPAEAWQASLIEQARQHGPSTATVSLTPEETVFALALPMHREKGRFLGAVLLLCERPFTAKEVSRAHEATELLSLVLLRALAEGRLLEDIQLLEGLSQWASELMRHLDEPTLAQRIGEGARRLLQAHRGVLLLLDPKDGHLFPAYLYGVQDEVAQHITHHEIQLPYWQILLQRNTPLLAIENLAQDQALPPSLRKLGRTQGVKSGCLVALQAPQGIQGVLGLFWDHPFSLTSETQFVLRLLGAYAGEALYNARLVQHLHREAYTDPLTGLPNRRAFEEMLQRETHRARRYGRTYALLVMDLDGFKAINDTFGHLRGDRVLQQTAQALRSALRESDFLARYGGDEFVALLPETTAGQAQTVRHKLVRQIRSLTVPDLPDTVQFGLSVGVALFPEDGQDPQRLLELADQRMYIDKAHGARR